MAVLVGSCLPSWRYHSQILKDLRNINQFHSSKQSYNRSKLNENPLNLTMIVMRWRSNQRLRMVHIVIVVRRPGLVLVRVRDASIRPVRTRRGLVVIVPAIAELQIALSPRIGIGGRLLGLGLLSGRFRLLFETAVGLCRRLRGCFILFCSRHVLNHCQRGNQLQKEGRKD